MQKKNIMCWKLVFSLSLVFGLLCSQALGTSSCYKNVTFIWGKWALMQIYYPALLNNTLPLEKMIGELVAPEEQPKDTNSTETTYSIPPDTEIWIAFVTRGVCPFKDKRKIVVGKGASSVIICNNLFPGRDSLVLSSEGAGDFAALKMNNLKEKQTLHLAQKGTWITADIEVRTRQFFWKISLCACCLILTFVVYFLLFCSPDLMTARHEERRHNNAKAELKKAVQSLEMRRVKKGETDLAEEICIVCLDAYKQKEVIRILTCRHVFHKRCIDGWLLKRGVCPICNYVILQKN